MLNENSVTTNPNFKRYKDTNYFISRMGDVYRVFSNKEKKINGYVEHRKFCFYCRGKSVTLARAIWELFVGKIPDGYRVVHINGYITDNRLENLKMVTIKESMYHVSKLKGSKPIINLKTKEVYRNIQECSKALGYAEITLRKIIIGKYRANTDIKIKYLVEE